MKRLTALVLASSFVVACGEPATTEKGSEENPLTDGKDDSFYRPTEHGALRIGVANSARITEDEQFHAWTFELTGDAAVELHTTISSNLDTVMYLYHRTSPDDSWGRYKRKNDDDGDLVSSRIRYEGAAGEYRVIVKPYKSALRGNFALHAECTGPGCNSDGDSCDAESFEPLPQATRWTPTCAYDLPGMLTRPTASSSGSIGLSEKCALTGIERTAIDYFHEFWDDIVGFDDQFRYSQDEDVFLNFEVMNYGASTVVTVDAGGDEDALSMYFDADGKLLAAYQHNQSPIVEFYCGSSSEAPIEGPTEDCFQNLTWVMPHEDETDREFEEVVVGEAADQPPGVAVAVERFASQTGLGADDSVTAEIITWISTEGYPVVETNVIGPDDTSAQYTVFDDNGEWKVILEVDANAATVICE